MEGAGPIADHPVCSSGTNSDDEDDLTVDVTSIEDVTVTAGEDDDEDDVDVNEAGECSTPCPAVEMMMTEEECRDEEAPCSLLDTVC